MDAINLFKRKTKQEIKIQSEANQHTKKKNYEKQDSWQQMRDTPKAKNNYNKTCENTLHAMIFFKKQKQDFR